MISWAWLIPAFIAGELTGIVATVICWAKDKKKKRSASVAALTDHRKEV